MPPPVSPLAPGRFPDLPAVTGVRVAVGACGVRYRGRADLLLAELAGGTSVAGVFTRSRTAGHPVLWCRAILPRGRARALVVNAGNANVFAGPAGDAAVRAEAEAAAALCGCMPEEVFVASTGVIGEPLDATKITRALPELHRRLAPGGFDMAARAIMTTDTFPKGASAVAEIDGVPVTLAGIAKGSGMVAPDMATVLAFVFTDACLPADVLQALLDEANAASFSCITVDGDTSTSDTLLLFATGRADHAPAEEPGDPRLASFRDALARVTGDLARQVVRDGEGASKLITVTVTGAASDASARRVALSVANSPLVKTAVAGEDANWGRVVMAVGKACEPLDPDRLAIAFGGHSVARDGGAVPGYDEAPVAAHLKGREITIDVDLGVGPGRAVIWTCDLTHGYIDINAAYRS